MVCNSHFYTRQGVQNYGRNYALFYFCLLIGTAFMDICAKDSEDTKKCHVRHYIYEELILVFELGWTDWAHTFENSVMSLRKIVINVSIYSFMKTEK